MLKLSTMPAVPADLAEIIATHRAIFGGYTMTAGPTDPPADPPAGGEKPPAGDPPAKPTDVSDEAWEALGDPGKKAIVAERDKAAAEKQRADALQKQIDDAKLSAEEKSAKDLKDAQEKAATAETRALKYEVAAAAGLDLKLAHRLAGATKAELEADAKDLLALVGKDSTSKSRPRADGSAGAGGGNGSSAAGSVSAGRDLFADRHPKKTS